MVEVGGKTGTRLLHSMIRVRDLDRSLAFYRDALGMQVLRKKDYPDGKFSNVFVGYGSEDSSTVIELTHNWDQQEAYTHGTGFGHLAVAVSGIYEVCARLKEEGITISRPPGPMKFGGPTIAFIVDPDGYKVELIET